MEIDVGKIHQQQGKSRFQNTESTSKLNYLSIGMNQFELKKSRSQNQIKSIPAQTSKS